MSSAEYSTEPRLVAQLNALKKFLSSKAALYEHFKYDPWTVVPNSFKHSPVRIGPSALVPGQALLGVFPDQDRLVKNAVLAVYLGVLMWDELHDEFAELWHCPTAVRVKVLDYTVDATVAASLGVTKRVEGSDRFEVRIILVGDPTHVGSIFNSPRGLSLPTGEPASPNCFLGTEFAKFVDSRILTPTAKTNKYGTVQQVNATVVVIKSKVTASNKTIRDTELLFSYDDADGGETDAEGGGFWRSDKDLPHCDVCMGLTCADDDALVLCSNMPLSGSYCSLKGARHRRCFELGDTSYSNQVWLCEGHNYELSPCTIRSERLRGADSPPSIRTKLSSDPAAPPSAPQTNRFSAVEPIRTPSTSSIASARSPEHIPVQESDDSMWRTLGLALKRSDPAGKSPPRPPPPPPQALRPIRNDSTRTVATDDLPLADLVQREKEKQLATSKNLLGPRKRKVKMGDRYWSTDEDEEESALWEANDSGWDDNSDSASSLSERSESSTDSAVHARSTCGRGSELQARSGRGTDDG